LLILQQQTMTKRISQPAVNVYSAVSVHSAPLWAIVAMLVKR